jgi:hypothetical protein
VLFGEDLLGDLDRRHRLGPAGVERQVHDRLLQFGLGEAVLLGEAQMSPELLKAARGDQTRDRDQTPVTLGKFQPLPDVAEQNLVGEVDQFGAKSPIGRCAGVGSGMVVFLPVARRRVGLSPVLLRVSPRGLLRSRMQIV